MFKVIVLDDEEMIRYGITTILNRYSERYKVICEAANGEEGMELIREKKPDVAIVDIRMPKGDGLKVLKSIREQGIKCKVVILTAHADFNYAQTAIRNGVDSYLLKPIDEKQLISELDRITSIEERRPSLQKEEQIARNLMKLILEEHDNLHPVVYNTLITIMENFRENISLAEISMALNVTPEYISSLFSRQMDKRLINFINEYKIDIAKQLLEEQKYKVSEIAQKLGFNNPKYFCKVFKDITSLRPSDYINLKIDKNGFKQFSKEM